MHKVGSNSVLTPRLKYGHLVHSSLCNETHGTTQALLLGRGERPALTELLAKDEHERLEFKSSLRFNHRTGTVNRELEKAMMETVTAFLNSDNTEHFFVRTSNTTTALKLSEVEAYAASRWPERTAQP